MKITQKEYSNMTDKVSPNSKIFKNITLAFLFGGLICTIGQVCNTIYTNMGLNIKEARAAVSVTLVFLGAF